MYQAMTDKGVAQAIELNLVVGKVLRTLERGPAEKRRDVVDAVVLLIGVSDVPGDDRRPFPALHGRPSDPDEEPNVDEVPE